MPRPEDNEKVKPALVHRPTDSGVDLPPGRAADELAEEDYRAVEMEEPGEPAAPEERTAPEDRTESEERTTPPEEPASGPDAGSP